MPRDIVRIGEPVILIIFLPLITMMDQQINAIFSPLIGYNADVSSKGNNISALPLIKVVDVSGKGLSMAVKVNLEVLDSSEINVGIGSIFQFIGLGTLSDISI